MRISISPSYDGNYCAPNGAPYLEAAEYCRISDPDWVLLKNPVARITVSNQITQHDVPGAQPDDRSVGVGAVFTLPQQRSQVGGQGQRDAAILATWRDQMFGHSSSIAIWAGLVYRPSPAGRTYAHQHRRHTNSPFLSGFPFVLIESPYFKNLS